MPDLPLPRAPRLRPPRWRDGRLVFGVLLVLGSVALGTRVVSSADDTVPVWAAARDLAPGMRLSAQDVVRRSVRVDEGLDRYVGATSGDPVQGTVRRFIGAGELVPVAAVEPTGAPDLRRLPVSVEPVTRTGLHAGSIVDVYVVPGSAPGRAAGPSSQVLADVTVDAVTAENSRIGPGADAGVVLLVNPDKAKQLLDAQAGGTLHLLQRTGMAGSESSGSASGGGAAGSPIPGGSR